MDFSVDPAHTQIEDAVLRVCAPFDDAYWRASRGDCGGGQ